jgi:hypothetical protein
MQRMRMARPQHNADEGGFALHGDNGRAELIQGSIARDVARKQQAKLKPTSPADAYIDENKVPDEAKPADEDITEEE